MNTKKRFFKFPNVSFFLFGPRGCGKSTLIKKKYKKSLYIDLLLPDVFRVYSAHPEKLRNFILAHPENKIVIIDEIQKVPELLSVVHYIIEEKKGIQFILTGSSARKLKRDGVNLLAGRAIKKSLHPFIASEIKDTFKLKEALKYGMLPLVLEWTTRL